MINSKDIFENVVSCLNLNENQEEIKSIAYRLLDSALNITKTDITGERRVQSADWNVLRPLISRINRNEPLQYIFGEQEFYGRKFHVNPFVLIPRPETECLIDEVLALKKSQNSTKMKVLDIGAGSGCIPITLALELESIQTYGLDSSEEATVLARHNALYHGVDTVFYTCDFLREKLPLLSVDIVVSNPPYVTESEKSAMKPNVLDYEPHKALFVPDNDPLLFYKAIAYRSKAILAKGGIVVVEINERFGLQVSTLFKNEGYGVTTLIQDSCGRDRVVKAVF